MQNNKSNENLFGKRLGSLLIDYVSFYIIYVIMIIVFYAYKFGVSEISTEILFDNVFDNIIKTPIFSFTYLGIILIWEVVIPLLTNGQSISKKILKIRVTSLNRKKLNLIVRSIIKIVILNPYGVIAYILGNILNQSFINSISNALSIVFIISVIMFFKGSNCFHDKIAKTTVVKA